MPQHNRVVERSNRMLMEKARSILNCAGMAQEFLAELFNKACYLVNKSPSTTPVDKTPYEEWDGKKPSLAHLRVFGCESFMQVPNEKISKLKNKSEKCIFIVYKDGVKGYKKWNLVTMKTIYRRYYIQRGWRNFQGQRI